MWKNNVQIEVVEFNKYLIAVKILDPGGDWYLVGFYGLPYASKKRKAWENLCALLETFQEPWICFGDFNIVMDSEEKDGGRAECSMSPNFLKDILFELGAIDLGFSGSRFTWRKKRWGRNVLRERLDRGISSMSWRLVFPKATIQHLGAINSDHSPILLDSQPIDHYLPRPFRFETAWTRDTKCFGIIAEAWKEEVEGSDFLKLCMKLLNTQLALKKWNKDVFGHCQRRIDVLLAKIQEIQKQDCTEENCRKEAHLQADLNEWLLRNEILWKQKSREVWLKEGDKNSKIFHLSTIIRRRRNSIDAVKNDSGEWITDRREIQKHFVEKFKTLFNEEEVEFPENLENLITPCITEEENMELCRIPTQSEIKQELF